MDDGIYEVSFGREGDTPRYGLAVIKQGSVNGGGAGFIYLGQLTSTRGELTGRLEVKRWRETEPTILGGLAYCEVRLCGSSLGPGFSAIGRVVQHPKLHIQMSGSFLSPAA